uniref:Kinetochore protein Spc24 n=1 Tax=Amazona collaria TaxID=241587 RepID=A0A8B9FU02_9PSIT
MAPIASYSTIASVLPAELRAAEESVARDLVAREAAVQRRRQQLRDLREELRREREELGSIRDGNGYPLGYLLHLYHKLSRISWDSEAKPWHIKGIHFGPPIAQPVDIDSRHHSHCFISDYLWSLIPHEW